MLRTEHRKSCFQ